MLEVRQPGISVDFERMDVIKNYLVTSSTTLFGEDLKSSSGAASAGVHQNTQEHVSSPISQEGQVELMTSFPGNEAVQSASNGTRDVPMFSSFNDWLSTFTPDPETADPKEDERLSAFRDRQKSNAVNDRIHTVTVKAIEIASPAEMMPSSDTLSLVSQHLPIRHGLPSGKFTSSLST
jgi:hypothetical protein